jgi:hypothetical protein
VLSQPIPVLHVGGRRGGRKAFRVVLRIGWFLASNAESLPRTGQLVRQKDPQRKPADQHERLCRGAVQ